MPYKLRKAPKRDAYWVVGQDGTKHSKEPLPKAKAEAQMRALYAVWRKGEGMKGGGEMPDKNILQQIAQASYNLENPPQTIGDWNLLKWTPTLKFYNNGNTIIVGIRGTKTTEDVKTWGTVALGTLNQTDRYKRDAQEVRDFQQTYPPTQYDYYGVGHSLGGSLLDLMIDDGLVKSGLSYNPAVQIKHFNSTANRRIYNESDPLYNTMGRFAKTEEVRPTKPKTFWDRAISVLPWGNTLNNLYRSYQSHGLTNFVGGKKPHSAFLTQLKSAGVSPATYLKTAQKKAKAKGLAWKLIGFADDGKHKLQVPNAEGHIVRFGAVGLGDHILYTLSRDPKADQHRKSYLARATKIKGEWAEDPYSPNSLAIEVLW
jgi:hypothetical protein